MYNNKEYSSIRNGSLLLIATLLISGCVTAPTKADKYKFDDPLTVEVPRGPVMFINDLNNFQINCKHKEEQVRLLQSMRRTKVEIMKAKFLANFKGPGPIPSERTNWMINYHLTDLRNHCYDE